MTKYWIITVVALLCMLSRPFIPELRPSPWGIGECVIPVGIISCWWAAISYTNVVPSSARIVSALLQVSVVSAASIFNNIGSAAGSNVAFIVAIVLVGLLAYPVLFWWITGPVCRWLEQDCRKRVNWPSCEKCGYCLRGLVEPRCPECGSSFDSTILRSDCDTSSDHPS